MGLLRISWAMGVVAPWCLGVGLVVSMSADAGQDAAIGASLAPASFRAVIQPGDLIPSDVSGIGFGLNRSDDAPSSQQAYLMLGEASEFDRMADEIEPRAVMKRSGRGSPDIDRTHKGDPVVALRPTFDTKLKRPGGLAALRAHDLLFTDETEDDAWRSTDFSAEQAPGPESVASFEPWPDGETPTTARSTAGASPRQEGSLVTMRPAAINERIMQGATPQVPRAAALASTTPAPADATPVEVVALPSLPNMSSIPADRPNYAALIDQDQSGREQHCLAEAIYFEARGESEEGQAAVAQVVLNRVSSGLYPSTICGVVYQNREHYHGCQFSFACEGRSLRITESDAWQEAVRIATAVTSGKTYLADIGDATHYHADYVRPYWAHRLKKMDVIGHHIFYKLRPGQT
jgi:spore germination cell wall hydrolase CwlJ-like protein